MGDWGEEFGVGDTAGYLQQANDLLNEMSAGVGTFARDLSSENVSGGRFDGMARGATAMALLCTAAVCCYRIWHLCHAKPHIYYTKPKVTH